MKKALVISCFFSKNNTSRPYLAYEYLNSKLKTKVVYSEFSHDHKDYVSINDKNMIGIRPFKYDSNISIKRIISHIDFSLKVQKVIKKEKPDIMYIAIPPNILGYLSVKLAKKMNIKVIVDIVDLWPEALPIPIKLKKFMKLTVGLIWAILRNSCMDKADYIISESYYFKKQLELNNKSEINVIPLCKITNTDIKNINSNLNFDENCINIGYLGAMNNIYDFESLIEICERIGKNREVKLLIIGDGERRSWLIEELNRRNIDYEYFGKIFDENRKYEILSVCDFGFNGYKENTEVALSYKSIDYLSYGLGLINSAKGDTWQMIDNECIGINYNNKSLDDAVEILSNINKKDIMNMKNKSYEIFKNTFSWEKYKQEMEKGLMHLESLEKQIQERN